jgi:hypothetical protein
MMQNSLVRSLVIGFITMMLCLLSNGLFTASAQTNAFEQSSGFKTLLNTPFNQLVVATCNDELKSQYLQRHGKPLNCTPGSKVTADRLLEVGNFANLGLPYTSMQEIAKLNGIDLQQVNVGQMKSFYDLVTPEKLLLPRFNNFYQNQTLGNSPLLREAFVQYTAAQYKVGNFEQLQNLSTLIRSNGGNITFPAGGSVNIEQFRQQVAKISLEQAATVLPGFKENPVTKSIPAEVLKSMSVKGAVAGLEGAPISVVPGTEKLTIVDFKKIGLPNISIPKMPNPLAFAPGFKTGKFDLPLGEDENPRSKLGRQVSGGYPGRSFYKQECAGKCAFVEISAPGTSYHGAIWIDGKNWVPDGYGYACVPWQCKGPAGSHPFGPDMRFLLTKINPRKGSAQVSITFRGCDYFQTSCTPAVFPIPSGIPLGEIREGQTLAFILPNNYGS